MRFSAPSTLRVVSEPEESWTAATTSSIDSPFNARVLKTYRPSSQMGHGAPYDHARDCSRPGRTRHRDRGDAPNRGEPPAALHPRPLSVRSEEHTSELQSLRHLV